MPRPSRGYYLSAKPNDQGVYEIRWSEGGRSKRRSTGAGDLRQAQQVLARFLLRAEADGAELYRPTVQEVLTTYLQEHVPTTMPASQKAAAAAVGVLGASDLGPKLAETLTDRDAAAYVVARAAGGLVYTAADGKTVTTRGGGQGTARLELALLKAAINYCIKNRVYTGLTAANAPAFKLPQAPAAKELWLTKEQAFKVLAAAQPEGMQRLTPLYRFIAIAMFTASRKEPVFSLTWDRVTFTPEGGFIDFQVATRRRTRKRRGVVPMNAALAKAMRQAFEERTGPFVLDSDRDLSSAFRHLCKRVLGFYATPHVLRHSWATWAAQDGVSMFDIAGVLHDSVVTVEKTYAKHSPAHLRKAVNAVHLAGDLPGVKAGVMPGTEADNIRHWPTLSVANG